jgi:hypothetical protein
MPENIKPRSNISIEANDEVSITTRKKYRSSNMPHYVRYGITEDNEDIADVLAKVSKPAHIMFVHLKRIRDAETNMATLPKGQNISETNAQNTALRELEHVGLIKRVGTKQLKTSSLDTIQVPKRTFLINPRLLIPRSNEDFEVVYYYWQQLLKS